MYVKVCVPTPALVGLKFGLVTPVPDQIPPKFEGLKTVFKSTTDALIQIESNGSTVGVIRGLTLTIKVSLEKQLVIPSVYSYII